MTVECLPPNRTFIINTTATLKSQGLEEGMKEPLWKKIVRARGQRDLVKNNAF